MKTILFLIVTFFIGITNTAAQPLEGKYFFTADSDNKKAKANSNIYIIFSTNGKFTFKATMPGTVIEDKGTYKINGSNITVAFTDMEQGSNTGTYSLQDGTLVLPFKMLNAEKGSSTWQKEGTVAKNNQINSAGAIGVINDINAKFKGAAKEWTTEIDKKINPLRNIGSIELSKDYYAYSIAYKLNEQILEAIYCMAMASSLQIENGLYQNNLAELLLEVDKNGDAITILLELSKNFPKLSSVFSNLAVAYANIKEYDKALQSINQAINLQPTCGTFLYNKGYIVEKKGDKAQSQILFQKAFDAGSAKAGRRLENNNEEKSNTPTQKNYPAAKSPASKNAGLSKSEKIKIWEGNYEAEYMKARSGENNAEANTKFGEGMTTTIINLQTLACVKSFNMSINSLGGVTGSAEVMYVYQGKTNGTISGMTPPPLAAVNGGFGAVLKDGFQLRNWSFSGEVDENGNVEINGLPTEKLDLYNVGQWQKISPWSPIKPDAAGAAMKGPFHFKIVEGEKGKHFAQVDDYVELNDKLIKKVHYQMLLVKTNDEIVPDCKMLAQAPATKKCPASEYIKTKVSIGQSYGKQFSVTATSSNTYSKNDAGGVKEKHSNSLTASLKIEPKDILPPKYLPGLLGVLSIPIQAKVQADGNYEVSVGVGVGTDKFLKNSFFGGNETLYIIYDSKCGVGVKGVLSAKYKSPTGDNAETSVEGVIFLDKSF